MRKALSNPETVKSLATAGMEPAASTPEAFGDFIKSEIEKWTKVAPRREHQARLARGQS